MNHWARLLGTLSPDHQRLIARRVRVSLPRCADASVRVQRLRRGLCRINAVRAMYDSLDPAIQSAVQQLRQQRGPLKHKVVHALYGASRSITGLRADPAPRSITEHLLLLGWLIPRPARPHHPAHYLMPPELRRWLPQPLHLHTCGPAAPTMSDPPAVQAAVALILVCAEQSLPIKRNGLLRESAKRRLAARMDTVALEQSDQLFEFMMPLLYELHIIEQRDGFASLTIAGQRWLDRPVNEQRADLQAAWIRSAIHDRWLCSLLDRCDGIDWTYLRRRLVEWIQALPADQLLDPHALHDALAAAFGPLANAHTHGFRSVTRVPWQSRRSKTVWNAALTGPLTWLGCVVWQDRYDQLDEPLPRRFCVRFNANAQAEQTQSWRYGEGGTIDAPRSDASLLRLLPWAQWIETDDHRVCYRITPTTIAQALSDGRSGQQLRALLTERAGPIPADWEILLGQAQRAIRFEWGVLAITDQPALLDRVARCRTVRRYLRQRPARGLAVVDAEHAAGLRRALQRQHVPVIDHGITKPLASIDDATLSHGERAALLVACAFYRQHAPRATPMFPHHELDQRLRAGLPTALQKAATETIRQFQPPPPAAQNAPEPVDADALLPVLRHAINSQSVVTIRYYTAGRAVWSHRAIRPLALEHCEGTWYLRAYCYRQSAERTFRVDRIAAIQSTYNDAHLAVASPVITTHRTDQVVGPIPTHLPDPDDLNALNCLSIEQVDPHAIGL